MKKVHTIMSTLLMVLIAPILFASEDKMNAEIVKVYREDIPSTRFIGKKYSAEDFVGSNIGEKWGMWFENNWFDVIKKQGETASSKEIFDKVGETVGLWYMTKDSDGSEYWIGSFMPANTTIPDGFSYMDFPASSLGVCWVYGSIPAVFGANDIVLKRLKKEGFEIIPDEKGRYWTLESYFCPRYTTPDEHGKVILDRSYTIK